LEGKGGAGKFDPLRGPLKKNQRGGPLQEPERGGSLQKGEIVFATEAERIFQKAKNDRVER